MNKPIKNAKNAFSSEKEAKEVLRNFQLIFAVAIGVLAIGVVFYHYVEKLAWIDALYFCVVTLTTVGYGDITPKTDIGKFFTIFYLLIGIGIIAALINNLVKSRLAKKAIAEYENDRQ